MLDQTAKPIPTLMRAASELRYASEAPKELGLQVRKSSAQEGAGELEASIRTHGIIVPLVVKDHKGTSYVTAGNRRLNLFRKIHGENTDLQLQTVNSDDIKGDAREIAMATNLGLPPHPVDRYEVIAMLVKEGMTPADAIEHFSLSKRQYNQIMRLGTMSPTIRNAWRDGEFDYDVVKAFALTDDKKQQEKVYEQAKKEGHNGRIYSHSVTQRLVGKQAGVGKLVEFVGVGECERHKLKVNVDLFGAQHTVSDTKLLQQLVDAKMESEKKLLESQGWAWASTENEIGNTIYQYGDIEPTKANPTKEEKDRIATIEKLLHDDNARPFGEGDDPNIDYEELEAEKELIEQAIRLRGYSADHRKRSGCILKISTTGKFVIQYGKVKPAEKAKIERQHRAESGSTDTKKKKPKHDVKSAALAGRLSDQLTKAAASTIAREPSLAIAAVIAGIASHDYAVGIRINGDSSRGADFVKTFESNMKGSRESREMMLAQICARALAFGSQNPDSPPMKNAAVAAVCNHLPAAKFNEALRQTFDAKDYFESTDKASIEQAVREALGDDHAVKVAKMKGPDAAKFANANVPATGWLPPWLRTAHYSGPMKGSKKAKKPKPAKKVPAKKKRK